MKGLVVTVSGALIGVGCGDDDGDGDSGSSPDTGDDLLHRLEGEAGVSELTDVYSFSGREGAPALVLGTDGAAAVGYLCDPVGEGRWFTGSVDGDTATLTGAGGGELTAVINGASADVTIAGSGAYDGEYALERSDATTLSRARPDGEDGSVGGLIVDGFVATGSFTTISTVTVVPAPAPTLASTTTAPTTTSTVVSAAIGSVGLGIRVVAGSSVDISLTVTLPSALVPQREAITTRLNAEVANLRALAQAAADTVKRGENVSECTKVLSVVAAVVVVVVAVVVAAVTAASGLALTAASGAPITSVSAASTELGNIIRSSSVLSRLEAFVDRNDRTTSKLIFQALRHAKTRATSTTTTATTAARPFPNAGSLTFAVR